VNEKPQENDVRIDHNRDGCATGHNRPVTGFRFSRRRLPHWQSPGEVYFVTFRTADGRVLEPQERDIALSACRFWDGKKIELYAAVVMPDHVHLLVQPRPEAGNGGASVPLAVVDLSEVLHSIKSFSAHEIAKRTNVNGAVWQHESYDRIVRDEAEFDEKWTYIANNAVMKNLAREPEKYLWFWYREMQERTTASGTLAPPSGSQCTCKSGGATVPVAVATAGSIKP
jgi:REP element-mobilizing transposase RayT